MRECVSLGRKKVKVANILCYKDNENFSFSAEYLGFTICYLHKPADVIHGDVGEPEGFGFGHATAGYLGYNINNFTAHFLTSSLFAPSNSGY